MKWIEHGQVPEKHGAAALQALNLLVSHQLRQDFFPPVFYQVDWRTPRNPSSRCVYTSSFSSWCPQNSTNENQNPYKDVSKQKKYKHSLHQRAWAIRIPNFFKVQLLGLSSTQLSLIQLHCSTRKDIALQYYRLTKPGTAPGFRWVGRRHISAWGLGEDGDTLGSLHLFTLWLQFLQSFLPLPPNSRKQPLQVSHLKLR